jgi:hypothetical protein
LRTGKAAERHCKRRSTCGGFKLVRCLERSALLTRHRVLSELDEVAKRLGDDAAASFQADVERRAANVRALEREQPRLRHATRGPERYFVTVYLNL